MEAARNQILKMIRAMDATAYYHRKSLNSSLTRARMYSSLLYYMVTQSEAKRACLLASVLPGDFHFVGFNWLERSYIHKIEELMLPKLAHLDTLYIPKDYPSFSVEKVEEIRSKKSWENPKDPIFLASDYKKTEEKTYTVEMLKEKTENDVRCLLLWPQKPQKKTYNELIFHIHGGGWCSMSPDSH
jgi:hypothetical protein